MGNAGKYCVFSCDWRWQGGREESVRDGNDGKSGDMSSVRDFREKKRKE